jgi:hypothetical protein
MYTVSLVLQSEKSYSMLYETYTFVSQALQLERNDVPGNLVWTPIWCHGYRLP